MTFFPAANATGWYVGTESEEGLRALLGSFTTESDARLCVDRVREILPHLRKEPYGEIVLIEAEAELRHQLVSAELNGYFPRGITDPLRRRPDTIQYWRSPHNSDQVHWVAYEDGFPCFVVAQGQLVISESRVDVRHRIRQQVRRHDPVMAQYINRFRSDLPPRDTPSGEPRQIATLRAFDLNVGMIVIDRATSQAQAVTYFDRRLANDEEERPTVSISFDRWNPTANIQEVDDHATFDVLDVWRFEFNFTRDQKPDSPLPYPEEPKMSSKLVELDRSEGVLF